ncbi:hypothetical protein O3G_MSEX010415 [Manduca sexta]|uniref:Uncharacterized protein n=1 Tax=Manduca sexta TaxID=7130 RepID=A0A922CTT8_MANSE|nr:hypothetical protein O3G_MSEX010415 [Manduca sexta]
MQQAKEPHKVLPILRYVPSTSQSLLQLDQGDMFIQLIPHNIKTETQHKSYNSIQSLLEPFSGNFKIPFSGGVHADCLDSHRHTSKGLINPHPTPKSQTKLADSPP